MVLAMLGGYLWTRNYSAKYLDVITRIQDVGGGTLLGHGYNQQKYNPDQKT